MDGTAVSFSCGNGANTILPVVGFIGLGVMGRSMAGHIHAAGYPLHVYTRTKSRAEDLVAKGALWCDTIGELAARSDVVITMVGFPKDVEEVYLGEGGILASVRRGCCVVDMTTSSPELAVRIYDEASRRGVAALDAPVSGGDIGAREARLSIMVGGDEEAYRRILPLFQVMGKNIVYQGKAGSGQHAKMANQIVIASQMMGVCEALAYAEKAGLDPRNVLASIEHGAAGSWTLSKLGPRMLSGDFEPGFYVKHFIKDMRIALASAEELKLDTPGLRTSLGLYERLAREGGENEGTQALFKLYRR